MESGGTRFRNMNRRAGWFLKKKTYGRGKKGKRKNPNGGRIPLGGRLGKRAQVWAPKKKQERGRKAERSFPREEKNEGGVVDSPY